MRILATLIFAWLWSFYVHAQLPSGSIAPDFTVTDINGNTHHLYEYLGQGYTVVLQFDATWNGPGWNYANSGALADLYYNHGVEFGGNVIVLFIDADGSTTTDNIYGIGSNTQGDWTSVVPFPIINLPSLGGYETQVGNDYNIAYFPTISTICPNGIITEMGQIPYDQHWLFIQNSDCQAVYDIDAYVHNYSGETASCAEVNIGFDLTNLGNLPLTSGQFTVTGVEPPISANWSGNVGHLESTTIDLGNASVVGPIQILFSNLGEQNVSNNALNVNVSLPQFETSNLLQVRLESDCWPEETFWNVQDASGTIIYSSSTYGDANFNTLEPIIDIVNLELPSTGCYFFTIYDDYGDGMFGSQWGCPIDGQVVFTALNSNMIPTGSLYTFLGSQPFTALTFPFIVTETIAFDYNVVLNVDMNNQVVSPNGVHLAGSFQGWNPGDPNYELFDLDGDGIYSIQFNTPLGEYEYKFVNGSSWDEIYENIPMECSVNGNRFLVVDGSIINETYCFSECAVSCNGGTGNPTGNCQDIFISEYVEGTSNNKAIELYNPTSSPIDLGAGNYSMGRELNGSGSPMLLPITGIIPAHGTRVFVLDKRDPNGTANEAPVWIDLQAVADTFVNPVYVQSNSPFYFNGDDAFVLVKNGTTVLDIIGKIGEDPGTGWYDLNDPLLTPLTMDRTLVRKSNIGQGILVNPLFFNPLDEWDVFPANDFSHLGWHESWCQDGTIIGCTDILACNYNAQATFDSGSCHYVGQSCDDGNNLTLNDVITANCNCTGVLFSPSDCDPSSIDWSNETSIWLPDLSAGENLNEGLVNSPYSDNIYINTPTDLGVIDPTYAGLPLESLELTSIQVLLNGQLYPLEVFGLSFQGNNGIETPSLNAIPGLPACIEISGIPNQPGVYPLVITFYFTTSFFGSEIGQFYELNSYEIVVNENPFGCTNQLACNYNVSATIDDGSCLFVGATCDDSNAGTYGDTVNSNCECVGGSFSYGILPSSNNYTLCAENTSGLVLDFETLPMGISEYALQWYCRDGIQTAPSGSSTVGWTLIPDATSSVYVTPALSSNKTFACFVTPFAGVGLPAQWAAGAIRIEVLNLSAQSIIGNPNITPFTNYVYVVNPNAGNTYNWSVTNGGIISGQGTNTVTVMWGQNGPYQISLTESNGICSDESTLFVVNNSCSISVAAVSANGSSFCPGTTSSIEAITTATGVTYQWYLNGAELTGETNIDLEITSGGNYQVMITQGICTAISQTLAITELPAVVIPNLTMIQSNPGCSGGSATITAEGGSFTSYLWSNGANTSSIDVTVSGDYTVTLSDDNGCVATAGPISVNFALQDAVPICLVTVDPTTGSNVIVWEPVTSEVTNAYVIYKETNVADVYAAIGTVDYGSDGIFEDINSNSAVQASRYKLALIDTCDIESSPSSVHKTIHLTSNLGVGNTVNLIWSHYEGFAFGSYNIYRGTTSDDMILLATIASNLNSFTDLLPLDNGYYMIEVEGVSCDPSRTIQTSTSNVINYEFVGVEDLTASPISIYPNPATDRVTISSDATVLGITYAVHDATGRLVLQGKMNTSTIDIDVSMLQAGLYVWRVGSDVLHWVKN